MDVITDKVDQQSTMHLQNSSSVSETKNKSGRGLQNVGAILAGGASYYAIEKCSKKSLEAVSSFIDNTQEWNSVISRKEAETIFEKSGLIKKGVAIRDYSGCSKTYYASDNFFNEINKATANLLKKLKGTPSKFLEKTNVMESCLLAYLEAEENDIKIGGNAFYTPKTKEVSINIDKKSVALPHELGHAKNANGTFLTKAIHSMYGLSGLTIPILLIALLRKPKDKREESTTFVGKSLDFVKDHAVALTAACNVPKLLEEGIASIRGVKMAKGVLSPEKIKAMCKHNAVAFGTYVIAAGAAIAGVWAANKIKNWLCSDDTPDNNKIAEVENEVEVNKSEDNVNVSNLDVVS